MNFAFRPDGSAIAFPMSARDPKEIRRNWIGIYDLKSRREVLSYPGHAGLIPSLAYSPDGRTLASAGADLVVRLWDTSVDQELLTLKSRDGDVWHMDIGPDGTTIAALQPVRVPRRQRSRLGIRPRDGRSPQSGPSGRGGIGTLRWVRMAARSRREPTMR